MHNSGPLFVKGENMNVGDRFTRNGKTYVVTQVWGNNFGMREVEDEVKDVPVFQENVEEVKEAPKKVVRRKKA